MQKKLLAWLVLFFSALLLGACASEPSLLGTWESVRGMGGAAGTLHFGADGSLTLGDTQAKPLNSMRYSVDSDSRMRIISRTGEETALYQLSEDKLELSLLSGTLIYHRSNLDMATEGMANTLPQAFGSTAPDQNTPRTASGATAIPATPVPFSQSASSGSTVGKQPIVPAGKAAASGAFITPTPRVYYPIPNCSPSQLKVGDAAFISWDTTPNALRTTPDTHPTNNFVEDGRVPPGGVLEVLDGPVCNYGWVLWYVRTTWDVEGWTPETDGKEFWMLPIATRQLCENTKPTRLVAGKKAFVEEEPNDPVEVYKEMKATINDLSSILYRISPKEQVDLLEGPFCGANGANWWRVRTKTKVEGYIRENDNIKDYYFMAPVP